MYGGCCRKTTKFQRRWEVAVRCVFWKIHCSKKNSCILFENWIWGHANILTLEGQKDNFDKVREISILLFVKFLTAFVNLSRKGGTIRMRGGHVV